jgi:hypothetical protein
VKGKGNECRKDEAVQFDHGEDGWLRADVEKMLPRDDQELAFQLSWHAYISATNLLDISPVDGTTPWCIAISRPGTRRDHRSTLLFA